MVGLVVVSHSARLAEGISELVREVGGADLPFAATGGLDLPGQPLGTDAARVLRAIEAVYSDDGVLVLMDLGSAVLSAEMARDLLPPEWQDRVILCEAPLVEGAVAAAVQARLGAPLSRVVAEARGALAAKAAHLGAADLPQAERQPEAAAETPGERAERRLKVADPVGLHARPAATFVKAAGLFPGVDMAVSNLSADRGPANARSITAVLSLDVRQGDEVLLSASGPGAAAALAALAELPLWAHDAGPGVGGGEP